MSEKDEIQRNGRINRRKFLTGVGAGTTAAVAGCGGNNPTDTPGGQETPEDTPDGTPTDTPMSGPIEGGKPVEALHTAPTTLNPLDASTSYEFEIIDKVYDYATAIHPDDYSFTPWSIQDWSLNPDNIGDDPSNPAITASLRDDLSFSDGEAVTAEDFKFSIDYITEQQPDGSITAAPFASVDEVQVDSPDGTEVSIFMTAKDNRWFTGILGTILLPQHIWSNVSDYSEYAPRNEGGPIGSGPMVLDDFSWENWFELSFRPNDQIPWPSADYVDWIHDDAPFIDGVRVEIFGSKNAKEQALLNGEVDAVGVEGVSVDKAVQAQQDDSLEVHQAQTAGYSHTSVNVRRVPFDDVAFRQLLRKLTDGDWIVEDFFKGIGAVKGDYASVAAFEDWRPPAPTEADEYEGIPLPDLEFPGEAGTWQMGEDAVQAARDFLVNHPDAKHDYSFGESQTSITGAPDGQELYVNGQHLNEAHTDNFGEGGQGPLVVSFNPPQEDLSESRACQRFIGAMKAVGIPVRPLVKTFNAQLSTIYAQEDFDMYAMGWGLGVNQTHLSALYSSEQADLGYRDLGDFDTQDEPGTAFNNNPMGYVGADDLIFEDVETLLPENRKPIVRKILAQIWNDAPTIIRQYRNLLEPTNKQFTGYVEQVGGVLSNSSWMNVRQNPEMQ